MSMNSSDAKSSAFADLLAKADVGGTRLLTPEAAEHAWCSVACPLNLQVRVEATGYPLASLEPLLPPILGRLLGQPLDAAPWAVPVVRVERAARGSGPEEHAGSLCVTASVASPPQVKEGLFEVSTPLGPARLRVEGLVDSVAPQGASPGEDSATVVLLSLPSEWLEPALVRRACIQRTVDVADLDDCAYEADAQGSAWRSWLGQWGRVGRLELSAHLAGDRAETCVLAVTFERAEDCSRCAAALGGGRLLVLQEPRRVARADAARCSTSDLEANTEAAWQQHLLVEKEIARVDSSLILQDLDAAVPKGYMDHFKPLVELLQRWVADGTLRATLTVNEQRRLHEADASAAGKSPEHYRRACWYSALRIVMQIEPGLNSTETLALALCEHWRKNHGICVDFDSEAVSKLAAVLQAVREHGQREEDSIRRAAEEEALSAEKALLEELDEEESRAKSEREKKEKRKEKKKEKAQRKARTSSGSSSSGGQPSEDFAEEEEEAPLDAARRLLAALPSGLSSPPSSTPPGSSPEAIQTPRSGSKSSVSERPSYASKAAKKPSGQQGSKGSASSASTATTSSATVTPSAYRREPDLDTILAAVRKSEELHQQHHQPTPAAGPKLFQAAVAATKPKEKKRAPTIPVGTKDADTKPAAGAPGPDASSTSSTTSTAWEASSCSSSSEIQPQLQGEIADSSSATPAADSSAAPSNSSGSAQCPAEGEGEVQRPEEGLNRPAVAGLSVDTAGQLAVPQRRAWVDELEEEEEDGDEDFEEDEEYEDSVLSPSSSPTKRRRRRRRGGARLSRAAAAGRPDEESTAATPTCNGRKSVVTWGDLGLGIVRSDGDGDVAVAKAAPAQEAAATTSTSTLRKDAPDWTPTGAAAAGGAATHSTAPAGPAKLPDASSRCLSTGFRAQPQHPVTPVASARMRDASSRMSPHAATPTANGYGQPVWGQEQKGWGAGPPHGGPMLPQAAVGQVAECWSPYDASGRYTAQSPMAQQPGPMTPVGQQHSDMGMGGCWGGGYSPAGPAPYGDGPIHPQHHPGDMMVHGAASPHHGNMLHYHDDMHGAASPHHHVDMNGMALPHHADAQGPPPPQHSADGSQDTQGEMLTSWLHASGLPSNGEDLAERLRDMAPEVYED